MPTRCVQETTGRQPVRRFPSGATLALPAVSSEGPCAKVAWRLESAPAENRNDVVLGADGARFSPHVPGSYRFTAGSDSLEVTVIDGASAPFAHFNYYPGRSIATVGEAVWVADVFAPRITVLGTAGQTQIPVGPWPVAIAWRPGMVHALVAQRASDDLGLVDVASQRLVDAIPVGDEPAEVVVSPDGRRAYVSLAVAGAVAVVDLERRVVTSRIELAPDVRALALSPDGSRLYAARLRSGQPVRAPFADTPVAAERDLFFIDTGTGKVVREVLDVGATLRHLEVSADGKTLYLVRLRNETRGNLADGTPHFLDEVVRLDAASGEVLTSADLGRQASAAGFAVSLQGLVEHEGQIGRAHV